MKMIAARSLPSILPLCWLLIVAFYCIAVVQTAPSSTLDFLDDLDDDLDDDDDETTEDEDDDDDFCSQDRLSTLDQLIVLFRHGDRTPEDIFPTDIHKEDSWPLGYGQLTERGILRSYELGQWSRTCYRSHLSNALSTRGVYVRSSNYDRTLMSVKAHLAGAYPQIKGREFPIHTVPVKSDPILRGHKKCPRFRELGDEIDSRDWARKILDPDANFLNMVREKSGLNSTNILRPTLIVSDSVLVELENNLPIVEWLNEPHLIEKLKFYTHLAFNLYYNDAEMSKLVGGPLLQEVINRMNDRASGSSTLQHILYSGHSTVMGGLLGSLGTMNNLEPPYASAVIFELHKMSKGNYVVKTYYRNSTLEDPYPLEIVGCDSQDDHGCTLEEFQKALAHRVSRNHQADCASKLNANKQPPVDVSQSVCTSRPKSPTLGCGDGSPSLVPKKHAFTTGPDGAIGASQPTNKSNPSSSQQIADQEPRIDYNLPTLGMPSIVSKDPIIAK